LLELLIGGAPGPDKLRLNTLVNLPVGEHMELHEMSIKSLLDLHNELVEKPAGPKSFATKAKLIARIESIAANRNIALASSEQPKVDSAVEQHMQSQTENTAATDASPELKKASGGKGIGRLARGLLLDPAGYTHAAIAEMVNARIEGAQATAKSVRWYACRMRKEGTDVPARRRTTGKMIGADAVAEPAGEPCDAGDILTAPATAR
jgi:hypothetical protein